MINITGLSKAAVLKALYDNAKPLGMGFLHYNPKPMELAEAEELLIHSHYFDYVHGRVMKVDLKYDTFNPWLYDRDNGEGAAERVITLLRYQLGQKTLKG